MTIRFAARIGSMAAGYARLDDLLAEQRAVVQKIGRYEVLEELGRGAMGVVYRARDPQIGRIVAIKVIHTANASPADIERYKKRFQQEAQAAGRLSHSGIVTVHDIAEDESGQPYIVMEFIEGTPLDKHCAPPAAPPLLDEVLDIGAQVAQALAYAHENGVIHRDIKPGNILVTADGRATIADFGVAKLAGSDLTQDGSAVGTPSFMSPEQFCGSKVDARSDLFSLGAVLYWMATGHKPFQGDSISVVSFKIAYEEPPPPRQFNPALPEEFETILSRCLAKEAENRYASCGEMARDLEALRTGGALGARRGPPTTAENTPQYLLPGKPRQLAESSELASTQVKPRDNAASTVPDPLLASKRGGLGLSLAGGALGIAVLGAGIWFWAHRASAPPTQPVSSAPAASTAAPATSEARAVPEAKNSTPGPAPVPAEAPSSMLLITCEHNFKLARLEILVDRKPYFKISLRGKRWGFGLGYKGTLETAKPIPTGEHTLEVHVSAPEDKYEGTAEISGTFVKDGSRKLVIDFGKGSGVGVSTRRLTLAWK